NYDRVEKELLELGVPNRAITFCFEKIAQAIHNILTDDKAKWIFDASHLHIQCELPLTVMQNGTPKQVVIDRTFVDQKQVRWIIDYKTTELKAENQVIFLAQARQMHEAQLALYAQALKHIDQRLIRCGLYFPMFQGWTEWEAK